MDFSARARKPEVTVRELSEVVECEPLLTAELLRNVNSCLRGLRQKVDSVHQAIALLGIPNSTTILLTSALSNAMQQVESPLISTSDFRRETVERALFARETARYLGLNSTTAYTAAMLQDIMLPTLTRRYQIDYYEYLNSRDPRNLAEFEKDRFGWTHAEITAKTLLNWGFSNTLALAVLQHHDNSEELLRTEDEIPLGFSVSCSSLLMDVMRQSPNGVLKLMDLQSINQRFQVMEIAASVDQAISELSPNLHNPVSLVHRLQNAMLRQLEERRCQVVVPGRQFGNYVLEDLIRESTMGAIFKARHIHLRRPAAVKVLRADRMSEESIAQFETEVQLTSQLRHPNTIAIFDYGRTPDDLFFYAMEFIDGMTLSELVHRCGPLPDGRVLKILQQICSAMAEAHDLTLIHRDIKPDNIMVSLRSNRPDHITMLDFGLVISSDEESIQASGSERKVVGTPLYMSPEAAIGRETITIQSDLYSIAAVAYYLLTGQPVFTGKNVREVLQQHMRHTPVKPTERFEISVSAELEDIIMRCLRKKPEDRPETAHEVLQQLAAVVPVQPWSRPDGMEWWQDNLRGRSVDVIDDSISITLGAIEVGLSQRSSTLAIEQTIQT